MHGLKLYYLNGEELPWTHSHTDLGVTIDDTLRFHGQARVAARKDGGIAHSFLKATLCRDPDFMLHILCTHIRPVTNGERQISEPVLGQRTSLVYRHDEMLEDLPWTLPHKAIRSLGHKH